MICMRFRYTNANFENRIFFLVQIDQVDTHARFIFSPMMVYKATSNRFGYRIFVTRFSEQNNKNLSFYKYICCVNHSIFSSSNIEHKKKQKYIIIFVFGFVLWVNNFVVWIDFVRVLNRMLYVILIYCCLFRFSECYEYILVNFERILPILLSAKWNHIWVRITEITIDEE